MATTTHLNPLRALALAALALAGASLVQPSGAAAYGWPVKPFDRQHPVRGFFGDPRIDDADHTGSLHFGVDVVAPDGTPVYATLTGRVAIHPRHRTTVTVSAGGGRVFEYWHVVPAVRPGQWVEAYRTVVGHVEAPWAHVHFSETLDGRYVNPLRRGAMAPYVDRTRPEVTALTVERRGTPLGKDGLAGRVDLVAQVRDRMPVAAPEPWRGKPVTPALVRWRLVGRRGPATAWRTAVDFRLSLPAGGFAGVYARWTRQNKPWRVGRYRVYLVRGLDTRGLADGRYSVQIAVADTRGNRSSRAEPVVVRNAPRAPSAAAAEREEEHEQGDDRTEIAPAVAAGETCHPEGPLAPRNASTESTRHSRTSSLARVPPRASGGAVRLPTALHDVVGSLIGRAARAPSRRSRRATAPRLRAPSRASRPS